MEKRLNVLPVPTWNRLSVNEAGAEFSLPEETGAPAEPTPTAFESGIGAYFDAYVREHAKETVRLSSHDSEGAGIRHAEIAVGADGENVPAAYHFLLTAEPGEKLELLQTISSAAGGTSAAAGDVSTLTEIYAKKGSTVRLYQVETASASDCKVRQGVIVHEEDGADVEITRAVMGGSAAACGARAYLTGKSSRFSLKTVYFASGAQAFDFNDVAEHRGEHTVSDLYTAGVLAGTSKKTLRGTIDFQRGASYAVGHETEDVLLLSNGVRNKTVPLILCGEENVEGQHAASSGRPDERQLYYLCSRGLSPAEATKLLIEGRFAPVLDRIPEENLRKLLSDDAERRLNAYAAEQA